MRGLAAQRHTSWHSLPRVQVQPQGLLGILFSPILFAQGASVMLQGPRVQCVLKLLLCTALPAEAWSTKQCQQPSSCAR